jgi:hypothetical protein
MASPTMWSGKQGSVLMETREYPKPCGSQIFNESDPLAFPEPTLDNNFMTFKDWTIALSMTMLERNMPSSRGEGWYPTMPAGEIILNGLVPRNGNPGLYLGCPLWWKLRLSLDSDVLMCKIPVIVSKMDYANSITTSYGISVSAKIDWSFDIGSSDPVYSGWVDTTGNKITPKNPFLNNYPWTLKGHTS